MRLGMPLLPVRTHLRLAPLVTTLARTAQLLL